MSLELEKDLAEENDHLHELVSATRYFKLILKSISWQVDEISDSLEKNKREYSGLSKSHKLLGEKLEKFQKLSDVRAKEEETERKQTAEVLK